MRCNVAGTGDSAAARYLISMLRRMARFGWVVVLAGALCSVSAAAAASSDQRAAALASQIESPFCPGKTLRSCSSPAAAVWRADIRRWVDEGVASEQIKERLSSRASRDLRVVPHDHTFGPLVFVSGVAGFAGLLLVVAITRRKEDESHDDEVPEVSDPDDDVLDSRLDDELALYDQ